ncbi:PREDICTED: uncharacterized protein LOC106751684 isoform X1 [Dinoponera quadriceps]|uniref:Uncharacterized protein LOC106751684 isoform X1 n=1 Tax=Dinoponera quadriceps TaxID=609295 RepID=A0A6P3YAZ4_DINQU|nr:PREDICTED: uncharacterized protein LOC106751684 isoform X1 [Dinoponera quadriceps]
MQANASEFFETFDAFHTLLQGPSVNKEITVENVTHAFNCARFVEIAIAKVQAEGKECDLEKYLQDYRRSEGRSLSHTCTDLAKACDKLLECYLKDSHLSTEIVDEYLKLYTQHLGYNRLKVFLNQLMSNSISINTIIESLEELGVPLSYMENEALIMSWEMAITNGDKTGVINRIHEMINDDQVSKLICSITLLHNDNAIGKLIKEILTSKLVENHPAICIAFADIKGKLLLKLLKNDHNFCINFIDAIFYFGRNMQQIDGDWLSDYDFKYEHLCKIIKTLLNGPPKICELVYNRLSIAKTQPDSTIWNDIEKLVLL